MSDSLTYADALKILGSRHSRLIGIVDRLAAAGLATWTVTALATGHDVSAPLNLFDLKEEIVRFGHETVRRISERRSGVSRYDRTQRLAAAHAVLVVSSYFEALEQADLPIGLDRLELTAAEQVAQATGTAPARGGADLIDGLVNDRLPLPEPHVPYERTRAAITATYELMSRRLTTFARGVAAWDALAGPERTRLTRAVMAVPPAALNGYEQAFRRLAADNREFEVWANLTRIDALGAGLSEVGRILTEMAASRAGDRPRRHLLRSYRAALAEPIVAAGRTPEGVVLPSLGDAYVNPRCKVAEVRPGDTPAGQEWWEHREPAPYTDAFLSGYLTSPRAVQAPLVVLGEPGSGKSKLTEVLAARLPEEDFLPIRVELRDVAAESLIQEQIEQAILHQSGERVALPDLLDSAGGALPVVMLDGFDEMLQAAGVNRYDYLEQVRDLQRRQLAIGHPVAVILTSRTVVADRVRYPAGSIALQLQPFTDDQVRYWLDVWNRHNAEIFAARGRRALPAETVLAHRELARQPLLLLMLAIFDANDDALRAGMTSIGQAGLYEALLMDFAFREIRKSPRNASLPSDAQRRLAEAELERLAVAAAAMFTRGRQTASEDELDRDLAVLLPEREGTTDADEAALSPAQRVTGRFFFIHRSEARVQDQRTRSYEFLHPTFGEFLVAWLTVRALGDLVAVKEVTSARSTASGGRLDDGFLFALLSFACVAERAPIVGFLGELLRRTPEADHEPRRTLLLQLLDGALYPHTGRSYAAYEPVGHPVTRRLAAYSANLTVLLVLLSGEGITVAEMFPGSGAAVAERWVQLSHLWKAQLSSSEWDGIVKTIRVRVRLADDLRIHLSREDGSAVSVIDAFAISPPGSRPESTDYDVFLSGEPAGSYDLRVPATSDVGLLVRRMAFLPNWRTAMLFLQSVPFFQTMGDRVRWSTDDETAILPAHQLARLDHTRGAPDHERAAVYSGCLQAVAAFPELHRLVLLRLRDDVGRLSAATVVDLLRQANTVRPNEVYLEAINDLWRRLPDDGGPGHGVDGRDLVVALVKAIEQRWPDADLGRLTPGLRVAAAGRARTAGSR
ncbi:hypothetical protein NE236_36250 [Actinoallomurus purpureus]|uniref:NACHT domain-containing protein n=1 Tax=Actinoallomurus purpureus TaxID=478114 RepID=UPI0020936E2D|nr:hypothetical protein [Actinoallomurus purpureus]MCO6010426.1 hypothetical protein [Actinoallomurus purpureus]